MTGKQQQYKKSLIQKIQVTKSNVFYDEESRYEFMKSRFNCISLTQMSIDQLNNFLNFCTRKVNDIPMTKPITSAQKKKINDLWKLNSKEKNINALLKFVDRIIQKNDLEILTQDEATKVIIAISKMK
jgi:phage gp16-like protein